MKSIVSTAGKSKDKTAEPSIVVQFPGRAASRRTGNVLILGRIGSQRSRPSDTLYMMESPYANYVQGALDKASAAIQKAERSSRNNTLNCAAFSLGQLIGARILDRDRAERVLEAAGIAAGLDKDDAGIKGIRETIKSGLDAGILKPRDLSKTNAGNDSGGKTDIKDWLKENSVTPIKGTKAETYLNARGIALTEWPNTLGFNPQIFNTEKKRRLPALIGLASLQPGGGVAGVQRIWLKADGSWKASLTQPKKALGGYKGAAIWFGRPGAHLVLCEGIENALSVLAAGETFVAAAVGGSNVANIIPPEGVTEIIVFGDHPNVDDIVSEGIDETGRKALNKGAPRWLTAGVSVKLALAPLPHKDANDLLKEAGVEAVKAALAGALPWEPAQAVTITGGDCLHYPYLLRDQKFYLDSSDPDKDPIQLSNFCARIIGQSLYDDGAEIQRRFEIQAYFGGRLRCFTVPADEFAALGWLHKEVGAEAIVTVGKFRKDHVRVAIQTFSGEVPEHRTYGHAGWREIDGQTVFLHAGGAVTAAGAVKHIQCDFSTLGRLSLVELPDPPQGESLIQAIKASLRFLDLGPISVTAPCYAAIWRAVFGGVDFSLFLVGATGIFKSQILALMQNHYGAGFTGDKLIADWMSTANALEATAYAAKDILTSVDDFAPCGSRSDVDEMHRKGQRLFRAQGNRSGRGRLKPDGSMRPAKEPRGLIVATGEEIPRGQSVRARILILDLRRGDINADKLTAAQADAAAGTYAAAMAAFIQRIAADPSMRADFELDRKALRQQGEGHARTPWIVADLLAALKTFLRFTVASGALSEAEAAEYYTRCEGGIRDAASAQAKAQKDSDPVERFVTIVTSALVTGKAHIANASDGHGYPNNPVHWGWRPDYAAGPSGKSNTIAGWLSCGDRVGWIGDGIVCLDPDAAYALVQRLAGAEGVPLPIDQKTLWKRLAEAGKLAKKDKDKTLYSKKIAGKKKYVVAFTATEFMQDGGEE